MRDLAEGIALNSSMSQIIGDWIGWLIFGFLGFNCSVVELLLVNKGGLV
jgi:hypothetical protein